MKTLVWQWGSRGAGPRFAALLAAGLSDLPGIAPLLSLAAGAEILRGPDPPRCDMPVATYGSLPGFVWRAARAPLMVRSVGRALQRVQPDCAICAMTGPLDLAMLAASRRAGIPIGVVVHDAKPHPGDGLPFQFALQRALVRRADAVIVLSGVVADRLRQQGDIRPGTSLILAAHPPFGFGVATPPQAHDGPRRILVFGRLLPYKGLDILLDALRRLGHPPGMELRIAGKGPESGTLAALRGHQGVTVENRWVPEEEIGGLLNWSDMLILPYREASQSGVAAAALAAGRPVIATRVGGLIQQLGGEPLATLCEPDGVSLAEAIAAALSRPAAAAQSADPAEGWRAFANTVAEGMRSLPAR